MIIIKPKKCILCNKIPVFNYVNEKKGIYCNEHKLENMVDIIYYFICK